MEEMPRLTVEPTQEEAVDSNGVVEVSRSTPRHDVLPLWLAHPNANSALEMLAPPAQVKLCTSWAQVPSQRVIAGVCHVVVQSCKCSQLSCNDIWQTCLVNESDVPVWLAEGHAGRARYGPCR